ncbi:hypothetical protein BDN72DRAFT_835404 [Pluteus cervinus]|uniref:Uncharacterized protein n=1 Tax=Pluteus cervinus TaxID=181527 RepID=A0ACD3B5H9_9AGAR|nr:hypothetical protein BDN72DRAFT_835404 [Pluteus cervinus]
MSAATSGLYPSAGQSLNNSLGAAFLGVIFASILFGITNLQVFIYYSQYPKDSRFQKLSVAAIWFLDSVHLALIVHGVYHYAISAFGDFSALETVILSLKLNTAVTVLTIKMVQCLYLRRIWILGRDMHRRLPYYLALFVVTCGTGFAVFIAYKFIAIGQFSQLESISWEIIAGFSIAAFSDFVVSAILCFYLQRGRSGFLNSELDSKVVIIMRYVVASGLVTSLYLVAGLLTFIRINYYSLGCGSRSQSFTPTVSLLCSTQETA